MSVCQGRDLLKFISSRLNLVAVSDIAGMLCSP